MFIYNLFKNKKKNKKKNHTNNYCLNSNFGIFAYIIFCENSETPCSGEKFEKFHEITFNDYSIRKSIENLIF